MTKSFVKLSQENLLFFFIRRRLIRFQIKPSRSIRCFVFGLFVTKVWSICPPNFCSLFPIFGYLPPCSVDPPINLVSLSARFCFHILFHIYNVFIFHLFFFASIYSNPSKRPFRNYFECVPILN